GDSVAYAALGGRRLPNRSRTEPGITAPLALMRLSGEEKPQAASWQDAHDWLRLRERFWSWKITFPTATRLPLSAACPSAAVAPPAGGLVRSVPQAPSTSVRAMAVRAGRRVDCGMTPPKGVGPGCAGSGLHTRCGLRGRESGVCGYS